MTTIRDIAKRADVSIGTIYQYVSDKEDVLFLTLIEVLDAYQRHVPAAIAGVSEPLARFHAGDQGLLRRQRRHDRRHRARLSRDQVAA